MGLNFTEDEIKQAENEDKILMLSLFMDSRCNLNCKYCFTDAGEPTSDCLNLEEAKRIVDEAKLMGAKTMLVAGYGEPLLDPKFMPLVRYAAEKKIWTVFFHQYNNGNGRTC